MRRYFLTSTCRPAMCISADYMMMLLLFAGILTGRLNIIDSVNAFCELL